MAAIIYRLYLFFSAFTPAFIYAVVAGLLVFLFSLRIDPAMQLNLVLFFAALGFSAGIRVLKDIWGQWPYAYHTNKFKVAEDEVPVLEKRPLHMLVLLTPYKSVISISLVMAAIVGGGAYLLMDAALNGNLWLLWLIACVILPACLWLGVIVLADNFFRAYSKYEGPSVDMGANTYLSRFFIFPELISFLILNVAIIWPLHRVENETADVAWVTVLVMSFISTSILLANTRTTPINVMTGALFSKLWNITSIDVRDVDLKSPKQYQIWQFSFKGWLVAIVTILMATATLLMSSGIEHWFSIFLLLAECLWVGVYLFLRIRILKSTLAKVAVFYRHNSTYYQGGQFSTERQLPTELAL